MIFGAKSYLRHKIYLKFVYSKYFQQKNAPTQIFLVSNYTSIYIYYCWGITNNIQISLIFGAKYYLDDNSN